MNFKLIFSRMNTLAHQDDCYFFQGQIKFTLFLIFQYLDLRDSENDFCCFSFPGYPKRNDFVTSRSQKKQPEITLVSASFCPETNIIHATYHIPYIHTIYESVKS